MRNKCMNSASARGDWNCGKNESFNNKHKEMSCAWSKIIDKIAPFAEWKLAEVNKTKILSAHILQTNLARFLTFTSLSTSSATVEPTARRRSVACLETDPMLVASCHKFRWDNLPVLPSCSPLQRALWLQQAAEIVESHEWFRQTIQCTHDSRIRNASEWINLPEQDTKTPNVAFVWEALEIESKILKVFVVFVSQKASSTYATFQRLGSRPLDRKFSHVRAVVTFLTS